MKDQNFIVRVPEPCHEDWNKMKPEEKGRFCNSCSKTVVDFSNKTDVEVKNILLENPKGQMCGHFKKSQLDRPLNYKLDLTNLPKNISTTKAFAIALFLVFGSILFSCTNEKDQSLNVVGALTLPPPPREMVTLAGAVMYETPHVIEDVEETMIDGKIESNIGSYVNGGIGYNNNEIINDSVVKQEVITDSIVDRYEYMTMGIMVMDPVKEDSTSAPTDSIVEKNTLTQIGDNVISNKTDLSIYPNPSTGEFIIKYDVTKRADVRVAIFDMKGSLIKTVVNTPNQYEGKYQIPVNLNELPPGIYIVNLTAGEKRFTEKVVISK